jgi:hypothetical protein
VIYLQRFKPVKYFISFLLLICSGFLAQPKAIGKVVEREKAVREAQSASQCLILSQAEVEQQDYSPLRRRRAQRMAASMPCVAFSSFPNFVACDFYNKLHTQLKNDKYLAGPDLSVHRLTPF